MYFALGINLFPQQQITDTTTSPSVVSTPAPTVPATVTCTKVGKPHFYNRLKCF